LLNFELVLAGMLRRFIRYKDPEKAGRVIQAGFKMIKIDFAGLQQTYDQT